MLIVIQEHNKGSLNSHGVKVDPCDTAKRLIIIIIVCCELAEQCEQVMIESHTERIFFTSKQI